MVVCIEPELGFYFRINTKGNHQHSVKLLKKDHPFLKWDSHLECGEPLELDDYCIEEALRLNGGLPIGRASISLIPLILPIVAAAKTISADDKVLIQRTLTKALSNVEK